VLPGCITAEDASMSANIADVGRKPDSQELVRS
jgi:hypothetical protein